VRDELHLGAGFSAKAALLFAPFMEYHGEIRDHVTAGAATRAENPQGVFDGRGRAFHVRASAAWSWSLLRLEGGFQRMSFWTTRARTREYGPGDLAVDAAVRRLSLVAQGFFASASLRF
jgi:hypothetical protein